MSEQTNPLDALFGQIEAAVQSEGGKPEAIIQYTKNLASEVNEFLQGTGVASVESNTESLVLDSFRQSGVASIGVKKVIDLVKEHVPASAVTEASKQVLAICKLGSSNSASTAWGSLNENAGTHGVNHALSVESFLPASVASLMTDNEGFGPDIDKANVDMTAALTVSLLKWHNTLTPRMLHTLTATSPIVRWTRDTEKVYDLNDDRNEYIELIDLYDSVNSITNRLTKIELIPGNAANGELIFPNVLAVNKTANLLDLSIDTAKPGHGTINRTDEVADGVLVDFIYLEIFKTDAPGTTEVIRVAVPKSRARLARGNNNDATVRVADIEIAARLNNATELHTGATAVILDDLTVAEDYVVANIILKPTLDLATGEINASGFISSKSTGNTLNDTVDASATTLFGNLTINVLGYSVDAKHAEDNFRKSSTGMELKRNELEYQISTGKNFFVDTALTKTADSRAADISSLQSLVRLGQDKVTTMLLEETLASIKDEVSEYKLNPSPKTAPGRLYAAGGKVRPYAIVRDLSFTSINSNTDANRSGEIKERVTRFMTQLCSDLHTNSFFTQQLVGGAKPCYRILTSNKILSNVLGVKHTHNHLDSKDSDIDSEGVELRIVLDNGVEFEVITTAYTEYNEKMVIIPRLKAAPKSILNFGHQHDYGTFTGSYTFNQGQAAGNRIFATTRETTIPTNAIGAIVNVIDIEKANFSA